MKQRNNKLGLQEFNSSSYKIDHRFDVSSMLEFSNLLSTLSGLNTSIDANYSSTCVLIKEFSQQFEYLADAVAEEELVGLFVRTLQDSDSESNIKKFPANNSLFLVFKLLQTICNVVKLFELNSTDHSLFIGDRKQNSSDKIQSLLLLKKLESSLHQVCQKAFHIYGMTPELFLQRFNDHPLWQNIVSKEISISI